MGFPSNTSLRAELDAQGYSTGVLEDDLLNFLQTSTGLSSSVIQDQLESYLTTAGYTGSLGDMIGAWDGTLGDATLALSLDFTTGTLDSRITFTRATTATYFNSSGVLSTATSGTARFDYDPVTLAAKGLLIEEARTNLLTYSEQIDHANWLKNECSVTANAVAAPDGNTTADKVYESVNAGGHYPFQSPTTTAAAHTFSIFAKAAERSYVMLYHTITNAGEAFSLTDGSHSTPGGVGTPTSVSATNVGNGWWRLSITTTATAAANGYRVYLMSNSTTYSYTGDGSSGVYLWGAQTEAGAFPTSYIPTTTTSVTRNADVAAMTGTNFSDWYNQTEGTLFIEATLTNSHATFSGDILHVSNGTIGEGIFIYQSGGINLVTNERDGGATTASFVMNCNVGTTNKTAFAYKINDIAGCVNGGTVQTDISATLGTPDRLTIGIESYSGSYTNHHIKTLRFYNTRKSNADLQALTA